LTGAPVFTGHNTVEVLGHHLHTRPARPSERLGRPLPGCLEEVILSCLEKDPERRPREARAWWAARDARPAPQGRSAVTGARPRPAPAPVTEATPAKVDRR